MADPFLEREKELMKLNESLNSKMSFDLKIPKPPINVKSANKMKKITTNKLMRCDGNQAKNTTKDTNKLKTDINSGDAKKPHINTYTIEKCDEKHELDPKDAAFNSTNHHIVDDAHHKQCNETKRTINADKPNNNSDKISNALIECIEKSNDNKSSSNINHLSLIPSNVFRKNISTDGIIK